MSKKKLVTIIICAVILAALLIGSISFSVYAYGIAEENKEDDIILDVDQSTLQLSSDTASNQSDNGVIENVNIYTDADSNQYIYDSKTGKLCAYNGNLSSLNNGNQKLLTEKKITQIADNLCKRLSNGNYYTMTDKQYDEETEIYNFTYYHFVSGYKSSDFIFVGIDSYGNIANFAAPNVDSFKKIKNSAIDISALKNQLEIDIKNTFATDMQSYKIDDEIIALQEDNSLKMFFYVEITLTDGTITTYQDAIDI